MNAALQSKIAYYASLAAAERVFSLLETKFVVAILLVRIIGIINKNDYQKE